jgi:glycosyltransferase involved in cell wall biosynthesis
MRIAIVSKSNRKGGGASRVAEDLALWLNDMGHPTHQFCARFHGKPLAFQRPLYGLKITERLVQLTHFMTRRFGFSEILPLEYIVNFRSQIKKYDIIHFHDLYKTISPKTLRMTSKHKPTFFTIHDYSAFTGGCIYPLTCCQFLTNCSISKECNLVRGSHLSDFGISYSHKVRKQLARDNITYIFPSQWMADRARMVLNFRNMYHIIHNGISESDYYPTRKDIARRRLGLPDKKPIIVLSAFNMSDIRKGINYACDAVSKVRELSPLVLLVGKPDTNISSSLSGIDHLFFGYIEDPETMALVYSAADALLFCSLADNLPLTVLEAMAVGTPVIGFSSGGVPEMVVHNSTGFLSAPFDTQRLSEGLGSFLRGDIGLDWGRNSKLRFDHEFSRTRFLEKHIELYKQVSQSMPHTSCVPAVPVQVGACEPVNE